MATLPDTDTQYRVYITPKSNTYTYGAEIEVSDYVTFEGLGKIKSQIDATDYNVGVFTYDDLNLVCMNIDGRFNEESDIRSIFKFTRDQAKVRVVFSQTTWDPNAGTDVNNTVVFRGIINEEATKLNAETDQITFKVLSRDSVIRNTNVPSGVVTDGMSAKAAMTAILSQVAITAVLTISGSNINPDYNFTIDIGSKFDDVSVRDALNNLLVASNSVMIIADDGTVTIKDRMENQVTPVLNLYGPYDIYRRQNTIKLTDYNTGKHRMYNSWNVNDVVKDNAGYQQQYGFRQNSLTLDFITDVTTESDIAANLLDEFKFPKLECEVVVPVYVAPTIKLLDAVSLNWPLLLKPWLNSFFPVVGITKIGDTEEPLPLRIGTIDIQANVAWKVLQIEEDPKTFTKTLKLRQIGKDISDGYFTVPGATKIGFAIIGDGAIGGTGTTSYNPSVVGAAQVGNTMIA